MNACFLRAFILSFPVFKFSQLLTGLSVLLDLIVLWLMSVDVIGNYLWGLMICGCTELP